MKATTLVATLSCLADLGDRVFRAPCPNGLWVVDSERHAALSNCGGGRLLASARRSGPVEAEGSLTRGIP